MNPFMIALCMMHEVVSYFFYEDGLISLLDVQKAFDSIPFIPYKIGGPELAKWP